MRTPGKRGTNRPRLRLRVSAAAERQLRAGHPWLFANSIREQNRQGQLGELAIVYDSRDRFLAAGLYDPDSPLRMRVLHRGRPVTLDAQWWSARLEQALARREGLFDSQTNGYRWVNGESDGWPALVLDRYDATLVLKLYSGAWLERLPEIADLIWSRLRPSRLVLRLSRNLHDLARARCGLADGQVLRGDPLERPIVFMENGLRFEADVLRGQKTGFFLDQRENRRRVEGLAAGRSVLNAFSFSGSFSLYAARGGAASVSNLDISAHALKSGERNFALNRSLSSVRQCPSESIQADAFEWLAGNPGRHFDLVILDPPSLAKREAERQGAIKTYERLISLGITHLSRRGILVACSCSAHVSAEEFFQSARRATTRSGRTFKELETTRHSPDHPATFPEAEYLKATFLRGSE